MSETLTQEDVIEILEPSTQIYEFVIGGETYYQEKLSFFRKIELFSVLADAIDKALADGALISEFLGDIPEDSSAIQDSDIFVKGLLKVVKYSEDLLKDIISISLNVPRRDRVFFNEALDSLTDEEAMTIINNFVDQNWDAMKDFFTEQVLPLVTKVSGKLQSQSTSSKPSNPSRRRAQKR